MESMWLLETELNGESITDGFIIVEMQDITTKSNDSTTVDMFKYLTHDSKGRVLISDAADRFIETHSKRS